MKNPLHSCQNITRMILESREGSTKIKPEYVIGKSKDGRAIALIWDNNKKIIGALTKYNHREILNEVKTLCLKKPIEIYASVNAGPNYSPSYNFNQVSLNKEAGSVEINYGPL